ncbi:uncharacterized protein EI97DRAFT_102752 [Westerdykella ornata]|uniref:FAS1 domain-containing protein n=1 Tax=Westerdykella ornata TaxID=318751 RepID=A0A6A6JE79_WESOR|nr:uncharacterized protein EI97DRAFT_102752 [Westerdykella ornata]KAF2274575.1 hypothetical protein EI97DRAFT_102752 [Westerdykella ornata]
MQLSASLALLALSSCAFAQGLQITDSVAASVLNVLATAIPAESVSSALADPSAFSSELASSLSAGSTPGWYQSLPADVKSYLPLLYPAVAPATTTPPSSEPTGAETSSGAAPTVSGSPSGKNVTSITSVLSPTPSASKTGPASSQSSGGAAALPTGMINAGVVGALGLLGMIAL